jgi:hypothetical protein
MRIAFIIFHTMIHPSNKQTACDGSTLPEIFLQYTELNYIVHLARKHKLLGYFRYVDVIMMIYDQYATKINLVYRSFTFQSLAVSLSTTRFKIQKFYMMLALRSVFCMYLRRDSDFCLVQH